MAQCLLLSWWFDVVIFAGFGGLGLGGLMLRDLVYELV